MKCAYLEWVDSTNTFGWSKAKKAGILKVKSVGIIVKENKKSITLAVSHIPKGSALPWDGIMTIPKCSITKLKKFNQG